MVFDRDINILTAIEKNSLHSAADQIKKKSTF